LPLRPDIVGSVRERWRRWLPAALVVAFVVGSAVLTLAGERGAFTRWLALAGQLGMVALFLLRAARGRAAWCSPGAVLVLAWVVLFTVPCIAYAVDPSRLLVPGYGGPSLTLDSLQIVNLALAATLLGWTAATRKPETGSAVVGPPLPLAPVDYRLPRCLAFGTLGVLAAGVVIVHGGGITAYVTHVARSATTNAGLTYLFGLTACLKFAVGMPLLAAWSRGRPAPRLALLGFALAVGGVGVLLGGRGLIVVGFVQFFLLRAWIWRRPRLRTTVALALVSALVLVFGLGALKRYSTYRDQHPGQKLSLGGYLVDHAPGQVLNAYLNNYVDTVRLVAIARVLVPDQAGYEPVYQLLHVALHPIPGPVRPKIERNRRIASVLTPGGGAYALPLMASAYLGFTVLGVAVASILLGWLTGGLDRLLARARHRGATFAVALVCAATGIPLVMRSGVPEGLAFATLDIVVGVAVTWFTVVRPDRAQC
jgi:hypothetical protein